jgi:hypothetical protein
MPTHAITSRAVCVAMTTYATTGDATAPESASVLQAHFEQLWTASGAPPLRGYETVLVPMLAAADRPLLNRLTSVDFSDPVSVTVGAAAIRQWRLKIATTKVRPSDARPETSTRQAPAAEGPSSAAGTGPDPLRRTA